MRDGRLKQPAAVWGRPQSCDAPTDSSRGGQQEQLAEGQTQGVGEFHEVILWALGVYSALLRLYAPATPIL